MSLKHAILGLLMYESMTGYDFKSFLDNSINFFWSAQLSQIYRDLGTLEKQGYVTYHIEPQEGRPDRKVYSITEDGEHIFKDWLEKFPATLSPVIRDEFAVRIFFGAQLSYDELEFQFKRFIKEKQEERTSLDTVSKVIKNYSRRISSPEDRFFWKLVQKRSYLANEALIQWAEECIQLLDEKKKQGDIE